MSILTTLENSQNLAMARAGMAAIKLQDARRPSNSLWTRFSCALDAIYLCALAVSSAPEKPKNHPSERWITQSALDLNLSSEEASWICASLCNPLADVEATDAELQKLIPLAQRTLDTALKLLSRPL